MSKQSKSEYDQKYAKTNIVQKLLTFNRNNETDMQIYDYLQSLEKGTANAFIKNSIWESMKGRKQQ